MNSPETRPSLLLRIRDPDDREAWREFDRMYRPVIVRLAKIKGMQTADAEDLAQRVLMSVSGSIARWQPDSTRAKFRTWLNRVTHNAILNAVTRTAPDCAAGNANTAFMNELAISGQTQRQWLVTEVRREMFQVAAAAIRDEFQPETWSMFWETAVRGREIAQLADSLDKSKGAIYAARSRVMSRLREKINQMQLLESDDEI